MAWFSINMHLKWVLCRLRLDTQPQFTLNSSSSNLAPSKIEIAPKCSASMRRRRLIAKCCNSSSQQPKLASQLPPRRRLHPFGALSQQSPSAPARRRCFLCSSASSQAACVCALAYPHRQNNTLKRWSPAAPPPKRCRLRTMGLERAHAPQAHT
jgi:hypothetical protein